MLEVWDGKTDIYGTQHVSAPDPLGNPRDLTILLHVMGVTLPDELAALMSAAEPPSESAVA